MNVTQVLTKHNIPVDLTLHHALHKCNQIFQNSSNYIEAANVIITDLGAQPIDDPVRAKLTAKALVEQAFLNRDNFTPEAIQQAIVKADKIHAALPTLFSARANATAEQPKAKPVRDNDKKAKALVIYNDHKHNKSAGEIAKMIATKLDITYSNAYYYVSRVFNK